MGLKTLHELPMGATERARGQWSGMELMEELFQEEENRDGNGGEEISLQTCQSL